MTERANIWTEACELTKAGEPFMLLTVIQTEGSAPRDPGAKMIWRPGARCVGTIGGGRFELLALKAAQARYAAGSSGIEHFILRADAEQCYGRTMDVFIEHCGPRSRLVVFGAGHVAHALARILDIAPLELVIVDHRGEWNNEERFPNARRITSWDEGVMLATQRSDATLACVMTCSHETDFEVLSRLLTNPPAFVGLIGSESKRACFFTRLTGVGIDAATVQKVHCPIGIGDMGKAPRLVALSIAGQVLLEAKKLVVRCQ